MTTLQELIEQKKRLYAILNEDRRAEHTEEVLRRLRERINFLMNLRRVERFLRVYNILKEANMPHTEFLLERARKKLQTRLEIFTMFIPESDPTT